MFSNVLSWSCLWYFLIIFKSYFFLCECFILKFQILFTLSNIIYLIYKVLLIISHIKNYQYYQMLFQLFFTKADFGFVDSLYYVCLFACLFWLHCAAYGSGISVHQGSNMAPCSGRWTPNHWTNREFPLYCFFIFNVIILLYYLSSSFFGFSVVIFLTPWVKYFTS